MAKSESGSSKKPTKKGAAGKKKSAAKKSPSGSSSKSKGSSTSSKAASPSSVRDWKDMHLWQVQPIRDVLVIASIVGLIYLGFLLSVVTVPILLAILLAYLFEPVIRLLLSRFHRLNRTQAVSIILATCIIVPASILTFGIAVALAQGVAMASSISDNIGTINQYLPDHRSGTEVANSMKSLYVAERMIESEEDEAIREELQSDAATIRRALGPEELEQYASLKERALELEPAPASDGDAEDDPESDAGDADVAVAQGEADKQPEPTSVFEWDPNESLAYNELDSEGWRSIARFIGDFRESGLEYVIGLANGDSATMERARQVGIASTGGAFTFLWSKVISTITFGFMIFLTCFFFFFFATGYPSVTKFGAKLLPEKNKPRILDLLSQMDRVVAGFIRGRLTICFIQSIFFAIGYMIAGTPGALVLGIVVGILSIVPYLALVGIPTAIMLMFLDPPGDALRSHWLWIIVAPTVIYFLGQAIDDYILTPKIQGKTTNMDTPTILFASLAGGTLLGVYGLLLAIPLAACLKILIREIVWPRFKAWTEGEAQDFLPISRD